MADIKEFLSFMVAGEEYGVPILDVREVRGWTDVRDIPNAPEFVRGVLNIRGEYVPIVDLRARLGFDPANLSPTTVVVVLSDSARNPLGIIVDAVAEVYQLTPEELKPPPSTLEHKVKYVQSLASIEGRELIVMMMSALFDFEALNNTQLQATN
ncbi:chemotaxis protein CheW [Shewanella waksmanii]|uniref:chemotaxis protein CheW n=1 Tax=Shewanella waksmanii TaxID=213783 RepID=UPI003736C806